jgi:hypothetical protein
VWSSAPLGPMPSIRRGVAMAYDAARQVVVAFGGRDVFTGALADTWEWNGSTWTQHAPAVAPAPRWNAVAAYDPQQQRVLLNGGGSFTTSFADTWAWNGTSWQQLVPAGPAGSGMAYDPLRQRMVLTGAATWEWIGGSWVQRASANANGWPIAFDPSLRGTVALDLNGNDPFRVYVPTVPATAPPFGAACAGSAGLPVLAATELPWLGGTLRLAVDAVPANGIAALVLGLSDTAWLGVPLPLPLGAIGMPGCELLVSMDDAVLGAPAGGTASWQVPVPNQTALLGFDLFAQAAITSPGTNTFGWVASNGVAASVGER